MLKSILLVLDDQGADHGAIDLGIRWSLEFDALLVGLGVKSPLPLFLFH